MRSRLPLSLLLLSLAACGTQDASSEPTDLLQVRSGPAERGSAIGDVFSWQLWWSLREAEFLPQLASPLKPVPASSFTAPTLDSLDPLRVLQSDRKNSTLVEAANLGMALSGASAQGSSATLLAGFAKASLANRLERVRLLGQCGDPAGYAALLAFLTDSEDAKEDLGGDKVTTALRIASASAIGALARTAGNPITATAADGLIQVLQDEKAPAPLRATCVVALGALGPDRPGAVLTILASQLDPKRPHSEVGGQVPTAWIRSLLDDPGNPRSLRHAAAVRLMELIQAKRTDKQIVYGCIEALGMLAGTMDDPESDSAVATLEKILFKARDNHQRHLALVALGRWVGAGKTEPLDGILIEGFQRKTADRPWGALALGIAARDAASRGNALPQAIEALADRLPREKSPAAGAIAIALALAGDVNSGQEIADLWRRTRDVERRTHFAIALGLLSYKPAETFLREVLEKNRGGDALLTTSALALGRLGVTDVAQQLENRLIPDRGRIPSENTALSLLATLQKVGGVSQVDPLIALLEDRRRSKKVCAAALQVAGSLFRGPMPDAYAPQRAIFNPVGKLQVSMEMGSGQVNQGIRPTK